MMRYQPRRQSKRFLDGDCPSQVLAIYDNGGETFDRYTVFYKHYDHDGRDFWIGFRGMSERPSSPMGFGVYEQMRAHDVRAYRERVYRDSCRWSDLPAEVQEVVRRDCEEG